MREEKDSSENNKFFSALDDKMLLLRQMSEEAKKITTAELSVISKRAEALKKMVAEDSEITAKYKIEVHFEKGRTTRGAFTGVMVVFRTGVLSGGGDEILYPCPNDKCAGFISFDDRARNGETLCPKCNTMWMEKHLSEIRGYKKDINGWAEVISAVFRSLDHSADIYLKTHWGDLRKAAVIETLKECRGDTLYDARKRVVLRYALQAILKDTAKAGSSLESRIRGLLRA